MSVRGAKALVTLLALGVGIGPAIGCAPALDMALAPEWPATEVPELRRAAEDWNQVTNAHHKITFDGSSWVVERQDPGTGFNGVTSVSKRRIQIRPDLPRDALYETAKHEFGHALGLRHLCWGAGTRGETVSGAQECKGPSLGVMDPVFHTGEFSPADVAECKAAGAC